MSQCVVVGEDSKHTYNLPMKQASLAIILELIDKAPEKVIYSSCLSLIETVFMVASSISDLLNLKISEYPRLIADRLFKRMVKENLLFSH